MVHASCSVYSGLILAFVNMLRMEPEAEDNVTSATMHNPAKAAEKMEAVGEIAVTVNLDMPALEEGTLLGKCAIMGMNAAHTSWQKLMVRNLSRKRWG